MTVKELLLILDGLADQGYGKARVEVAMGNAPSPVVTRAITKVSVEAVCIGEHREDAIVLN